MARLRHTTPVDEPLTPTDKEVIEHRREIVSETVYNRLIDTTFQALADKSSVRTLGGLALQRQYAFLKLAMLNDGRPLLNHWPEIRAELRIPWGVHYAHASEPAWAAVSGQIESSFFMTKRDGFDEVNLSLYGGKWLPVPTDVPGFGVIELTDALEFVGLIGGQLPEVDRPHVPFRLAAPRLSVVPGEVVTHQLEVEGAGEFPVVFEDKTDPPRGWASVLSMGLIRLAPVAALPLQTALMEIEAVDGLNTTVSLTVVIDVAAKA